MVILYFIIVLFHIISFSFKGCLFLLPENSLLISLLAYWDICVLYPWWSKGRCFPWMFYENWLLEVFKALNIGRVTCCIPAIPATNFVASVIRSLNLLSVLCRDFQKDKNERRSRHLDLSMTWQHASACFHLSRNSPFWCWWTNRAKPVF